MDSQKTKELLTVAGMAVGIILALILIVWIPFKLIPSLFSGSTNFVASTLNSEFLPNKSTSTNQTTTTNTQTSTTTTVQSYSVPATYSGKPDLSIEFVSQGIIDQSGQFYSTNNAGINNTIVVKFKVKNIGGNVSGPWKLRVVTPDSSNNYDTDHQSINPGDGILFTVTYNAQYQGANNTTVTIDPENVLDESAKNNNTFSVGIAVAGSNYYPTNTYSNYGTGLSANCYAQPANAHVGSPVMWYTMASGGNGYFSYYWEGTDGLTSNAYTASRIYYTPGPKTARVTVYSNGAAITRECSVYIY